MFEDGGSAPWAWVAASDIINCYACNGPVSSVQNTTKLGACPATGLRTLNAEAQVRGDPNDNGCATHHYLATMPQGSHFLNKGSCDSSDCFWCQGYAYGEVNQIASIECSKLV
jgi:hypothetical protein